MTNRTLPQLINKWRLVNKFFKSLGATPRISPECTGKWNEKWKSPLFLPDKKTICHTSNSFSWSLLPRTPQTSDCAAQRAYSPQVTKAYYKGLYGYKRCFLEFVALPKAISAIFLTQQTVERKIALTAFRSTTNSRKHQKTTPGKV